MSSEHPDIRRIGVIGAGAWGTALANAAARAGRDVTLFARDSAEAERLAARRESPRLPGIPFEAAVAVAPLDGRVAACEAVLLVVPAQSLRAAASTLAPLIAPETPLVSCAKGIEQGSHAFMTEVIAETAPAARPAVLSGPSFAEDVGRALPTAVTLAAVDEAMAVALTHALGSATFRPYHTTDIRGVEIGGAAKNVLAIAAGIVAGRGLGASATAAMVTRGFAELFRFGQALGARPETLTGLSGLGDLVLTCSSPQSRNYALGLTLGRGEALPAGGKLAEGQFTAPALAQMALAAGVEMPLVEAVAAVLDGSLAVDDAIGALMMRPFRSES